ncbi:MAG: type I 3-dehydroquinate dehydratase [Phycisphaerales bacterium]|nr:type I 3-dehydroquinate dehydratase [Phycisphaerales bacterium]
MTLICVPLMVTDPALARAQALVARERGADLVEYRVEGFLGDDAAEAPSIDDRIGAVCALAEGSPLACIVTCRSAGEGGEAHVDDDVRLGLYERLAGLATPPRYIDVELASYERSEAFRRRVDACVGEPGDARDSRPSLILSVHDFKGRPNDLLRRVTRLNACERAAVHKVAFRARSVRDALEAMSLCEGSARPMIAIAMGDEGQMSRLLAGKARAFLTYAACDAGPTAPGQPRVEELLGTYRFRSVQPTTRVYGIVGWPVSHSRSPAMHNAGFGSIGWDGVYVPLPVAAGADEASSFASFKGALVELMAHHPLRFRGCSVTIPHKENLFRLASAQGWGLDEASHACGAANTLVIEDGGAVRVFNTDALAMEALLAGQGGMVEGAQALILGAGGMARAAAWACARAGLATGIYARDAAQARRVAALIGEHVPGARVESGRLDEVPARAFRFIVNCTPLGMTGGPDPKATPMSAAQLAVCAERAVVMDTVYAPQRTPFLAAAEEAGVRERIGGLTLLVEQARQQFEAWTHQQAPREVFERGARA